MNLQTLEFYAEQRERLESQRSLMAECRENHLRRFKEAEEAGDEQEAQYHREQALEYDTRLAEAEKSLAEIRKLRP